MPLPLIARYYLYLTHLHHSRSAILTLGLLWRILSLRWTSTTTVVHRRHLTYSATSLPSCTRGEDPPDPLFILPHRLWAPIDQRGQTAQLQWASWPPLPLVHHGPVKRPVHGWWTQSTGYLIENQFVNILLNYCSFAASPFTFKVFAIKSSI
jgi:hypothetical protein